MKCPSCDLEIPTGDEVCPHCTLELTRPSEVAQQAMKAGRASGELAADLFAAGTLLDGRYRIVRLLGRGYLKPFGRRRPELPRQRLAEARHLLPETLDLANEQPSNRLA